MSQTRTPNPNMRQAQVQGNMCETYHIPGYTGHIPTMRYRHGASFSRISRRIFEDPGVSLAPVPVLTINGNTGQTRSDYQNYSPQQDWGNAQGKNNYKERPRSASDQNQREAVNAFTFPNAPPQYQGNLGQVQLPFTPMTTANSGDLQIQFQLPGTPWSNDQSGMMRPWTTYAVQAQQEPVLESPTEIKVFTHSGDTISAPLIPATAMLGNGRMSSPAPRMAPIPPKPKPATSTKPQSQQGSKEQQPTQMVNPEAGNTFNNDLNNLLQNAQPLFPSTPHHYLLPPTPGESSGKNIPEMTEAPQSRTEQPSTTPAPAPLADTPRPATIDTTWMNTLNQQQWNNSSPAPLEIPAELKPRPSLMFKTRPATTATPYMHPEMMVQGRGQGDSMGPDPRPHSVNRSPFAQPPIKDVDMSIYHSKEALPANYSGHVPGYNIHSFGRSYGKATAHTRDYMSRFNNPKKANSSEETQ